MLNHVTYLYGFNLGRAETLVKDLSTEQMAAQPGGVINHPAWSLGHLVISADHLGQLLGLHPVELAGRAERDLQARLGAVGRRVGLSEQGRAPRSAQGTARQEH